MDIVSPSWEAPPWQRQRSLNLTPLMHSIPAHSFGASGKIVYADWLRCLHVRRRETNDFAFVCAMDD